VTVVQAHSAQFNVKPWSLRGIKCKIPWELRVHILYSVSREEAVRLRDSFKWMPAENVRVYQTVPLSWWVKELQALNLCTVYRQSNW